MTGPIVAVEEVPHGGYEVVVRILAGADRAKAVEIAREIRERQWVDLKDTRWAR